MLKKNLGQLDTHAPAAGELRCRAVEVLAFEAETDERALDVGLVVVARCHGELLGQSAHAVDKLVVVLGVVVGALGQLRRHVVKALLHGVDMGEYLAHFFDDRLRVGYGHLLWQVAYGHARGHGHGS